MKKENVVYKKAYKFALRIIKAFQFLRDEKKEFILSKQLLSCGTSIGANLAEANGAISTADFSNKISIAYKECLECKYWLSLMHDSGIIDQSTFKSIFEDADEIARLLYSILKATRINN